MNAFMAEIKDGSSGGYNDASLMSMKIQTKFRNSTNKICPDFGQIFDYYGEPINTH